jgi:hypothetical protein
VHRRRRKTRYHQKLSSGAVRRRYGTARWFAARRTPLSRLTRRTRSRLESSTKPVRDSHTCDNTHSAYNFTCTDKVWGLILTSPFRNPKPVDAMVPRTRGSAGPPVRAGLAVDARDLKSCPRYTRSCSDPTRNLGQRTSM